MIGFSGAPFHVADEIVVPSDPNAKRPVCLVRRNLAENVEILSRRDGPSGALYTLREVRACDGQLRYLGEGEDIHELEENLGKSVVDFSEADNGSIADVVAKHALFAILRHEMRGAR